MRKIITLLLLTAVTMGVEVSEIVMAKEAVKNEGKNSYTVNGIVDRFPPEIPKMFAIVKYKNAKPGTSIRVSFIAIDAISTPNYKIADVDAKTTLPDGVVRASLSRGKVLFPEGNYRVDVYAEGKKIGTKEFSVGNPKSESLSGGLGIGTVKSNPRIGRILFARKVTIDEKGYSVPEGIADQFDPKQHTISMVATYSGAHKGDQFLVRAMIVDAGGTRNEVFMEDKVIAELPEGAIQEEISGSNDWPVGTYRISVYFGGKLLKSREFQIRSSQEQHSDGIGLSTPSTPSASSVPFQPPLGKWIAHTDKGEQIMEILSSSELRYNGKPFHCRIDGKNIVIIDGMKQVLYPYERNGNKLVLHYADGSTRTFVQQEAQQQVYDPLSATEAISPSSAPVTSPQPSTPSSQLATLYCSNNADGNEWARFEANGVFYFGSLQDPNTPYGRGSYKVGKNTISLVFDGERSTARIVKKGKDGRIGAIEYDGVIYASELCPR